MNLITKNYGWLNFICLATNKGQIKFLKNTENGSTEEEDDSDEDDVKDCECIDLLNKLNKSLEHPDHREDTLEFIQGILSQPPIISPCRTDFKQNEMVHLINTKRNRFIKTLKREKENDPSLLEVVRGYLHLENVTGNVIIHTIVLRSLCRLTPTSNHSKDKNCCNCCNNQK